MPAESHPRVGHSADDALARAASELHAAGASAWPGVRLDPTAFAERVRAIVAADPDPSASARSLHAADLFLAVACARGGADAIAELERRYMSAIGVHIATVQSGRAFVDDVRQRVREELLVGKKIDNYAGRGPLSGWLRVVAIRTALNARRAAESDQKRGDAPIDLGRGPLDPEMDYLKARCREAFHAAFTDALAVVSPVERLALRLHHVDGLTLHETAAACRVSRATAARWLASARDRIVRETQRLLCERLKLGESDVESLLRLVRSQFEVSVERCFGPSAERAV